LLQCANINEDEGQETGFGKKDGNNDRVWFVAVKRSCIACNDYYCQWRRTHKDLRNGSQELGLSGVGMLERAPRATCPSHLLRGLGHGGALMGHKFVTNNM